MRLLALSALSAHSACRTRPREEPVPHGSEPAPSATGTTTTTGATLATEAAVGKLEPVALFDGAMPTGVTVSSTGRVFVSFPR
jgi:streptogramin lyase